MEPAVIFYIEHSPFLSVILKNGTMKKFILATFIIFTTTINAQVYIGGGVSFWDNNDDDRRSISFTPEVGFRINPRVAFGANIGYEYLKEKGARNEVFTFSPYMRIFLYSLKNVDLFWDSTVGIKHINPHNSKAGNCIEIGVKPGISYTFNHHFCVTASMGFVGYRHCERDFGNTKYEPGLGFRLINELAFSFHYYF